MAQNAFGGQHTAVKLQAVEKYLSAFTTALQKKEKKRDFILIYFDGFAGSGQIQASDEIPLISDGKDADKMMTGSVLRALRIANPFDQYVFVEKAPAKMVELRALEPFGYVWCVRGGGGQDRPAQGSDA